MYKRPNAREMLLCIAIKCKGDWNKIYKTLQDKSYDTYDNDELINIIEYYDGEYITIIDDDYPQILKQSYHPPFVLFMGTPPNF